ncbi:MAG TPA: hypothetical protein VIL11_03910, partial [Limnochordales bacterium]
PGCPVVALLPGSRRQELERLLPVMLETVARTWAQRPQLQCVVSVAPGLSEEDLLRVSRRVSGLPPVRLVGGGIWRALAPADFAVVTSGTATLQAALWQVPMVVVYRVAAATYQLARRLVRLPYISLPNIVAGRPVVQEFLQAQAEPRRLASVVLEYLDDPQRRAELAAALAEVGRRLGEPGASRRAASVVVEVAATS